jgi:hypothetical protein
VVAAGLVMLGLAVAVSVVVVRGTGAAASANHYSTTIDLAGTPAFDQTGGQCISESLTITEGTTTISGTDVITPNGDIRGEFAVVTHALATGDVTGTQYELVGTGTSHFISQPGQEFTEIFNSHLNGPGPDNNVVMRSTFHSTVTPNGDLTAFTATFELVCQ